MALNKSPSYGPKYFKILEPSSILIRIKDSFCGDLY